MKSKISILLIMTFLFVGFVMAGDPFRVDENLELGENDIYNATNVNATNLWQNGSQVLDTDDINGTTFNYTLYANSSTYSTYWDNETDQADLNVNSSTWWASITDWSSTYFENVADSLSIKMSWFNSAADSRITNAEPDLNVNSSDYWDNLNTPLDINASDITDDGTYVTVGADQEVTIAGENITSGIVADARIASTIARDSELIGNCSIDGSCSAILYASNESSLNVNHSDTSTLAEDSTAWITLTSLQGKWFADVGNVLTFDEAELNTSIGSYGDSNYLMLDQTSYQTILNGIPRLEQGRNISETHQIVDKLYVDTAVSSIGQRFYMLNTSSGIADYKNTQTNSTIAAFSNEYTSLTDGQYVAGWISPLGTNFTKMVKGIYDWNVYLEKTSGTKSLRIYWTLVERLSNNSEIVIATSGNSDLITEKGEFDVTLNLDSDYVVSSGSRIVGKIYAVVGVTGVAPDLTIYGGGDDDSHWEIPTDKEVLDTIYIQRNEEGNLNVNSSDYWDSLDTSTDITSLGTIGTGTWQGTAIADAYVSDTLTVDASSSVQWAGLTGYPSACPAGTFITQVGDSITCTAPTAADVDPGTFPSGNYVFTGGTLDADTLNTGQGDYELYAMNQDVETTDKPSFTGMTLTSSLNSSSDFKFVDGSSQISYMEGTSNIPELKLTHNANPAADDQISTIKLATLDESGSITDWITFDAYSKNDATISRAGRLDINMYSGGYFRRWLRLDTDTLSIGESGVTTDVDIIQGKLDVDTVNTGHGANELYAMNQDVETTDAVTFATLDTGQGANELYAMNQDVESTDAVTFLTVDTGHGANELYAMNQDVETTDSPTFANLTIDCKIGRNSTHFTCYNASGTIFDCAGCGLTCVCS